MSYDGHQVTAENRSFRKVFHKNRFRRTKMNSAGAEGLSAVLESSDSIDSGIKSFSRSPSLTSIDRWPIFFTSARRSRPERKLPKRESVHHVYIYTVEFREINLLSVVSSVSQTTIRPQPPIPVKNRFPFEYTFVRENTIGFVRLLTLTADLGSVLGPVVVVPDWYPWLWSPF